MTNPVASLAALLRESNKEPQGEYPWPWFYHAESKALAEWLLARGVQYAPREHRAGCAADVWVEDHYEPSGEACDCEAAPPRESGHCVHGFELRAEGCDLCLQDAFARAKREPLPPAEQLSELTADINRAALPGGVVNTRGVAEFLIARGWARGRPEGPSAPPPNFEELIAAARFALKECEEITTCYPNAGDFWGLADNAAQELRRALAGEAVSAFAKAVCAPPQVDVERLNRAVDMMMEQAKNLRDVLGSRTPDSQESPNE